MSGNAGSTIESRLPICAKRDATLTDLAILDVGTDADTDTYAWSGTVQLAERFSLIVYDAAYLELAQRRARSLASLDGDLRTAAGACGIPPLGRGRCVRSDNLVGKNNSLVI